LDEFARSPHVHAQTAQQHEPDRELNENDRDERSDALARPCCSSALGISGHARPLSA
jgi:hypothetical protein